MMKKRVPLFAITLMVSGVALSHARQVWPVQRQSVIGTYRGNNNSDSTLFLEKNGRYEHQVGQQKFTGRWQINEWDGDVTLVNINLDHGAAERNDSYIVGSHFGHVENLYLSNKSPEQWVKVTN